MDLNMMVFRHFTEIIKRQKASSGDTERDGNAVAPP